MSEPRPDLDKCGDCGRVGAQRDGCSCINDAFQEILAGALGKTALMCECACDSGPEPHSDRRCRRQATTHVAMHMWGHCDEPDPITPEAVDADGNLCTVMCAPCADRARERAAASIRHLLANLPPAMAPRCPSCDRPTARTDDIIELRPITRQT